VKLQDVSIAKLRREEVTQAREATDDDVAAEYWRKIDEEGQQFPAPVVFKDAHHYYWLADGWHTVRGYELAGRKMIRCHIIEGSLRDAILYAAAANAAHGLQRTRADRRRAVLLLLRDEEWSQWSNREIARHCCVDEGTVRNVRRELEGAENPQTAGGDDEEWMDRLTPSERAAWDALDGNGKEELRKQAEADALDERVTAMETIIARMEKRLGEDELGKHIAHDLRLFAVHARSSIGWESERGTLADDDWRERMLADLQRLRKLNHEMPGERPRIKILDRLGDKLKQAG
jgi:hypothetical protein